MANVIYMTREAWVNLLDKIRAKTGITDNLTATTAAVAVEGIQAGGGGADSSDYDWLISGDGSPAEYFNGNVTQIKSSCFSMNHMLETVSFPNVLTIGTNAFTGCSKLKSVDFPSAKTIGNNAFQTCSCLENASFPSVQAAKNYAFASCTKLMKALLPNASEIGTYIFDGCTVLNEVNTENATEIGTYAFRNCKALETLDLPLVTSIANSAFFGSAIKTLILRCQSLCTLKGTNAFGGSTPIAGGTGYIYVPSALVDTYKTATNWSTYAAQFRAIEDYPEICGGV